MTDPSDPNRCQMSKGQMQCVYKAEPGSNFCSVHTGVDHTNDRNVRMYLLAKAEDKARLHELADHAEIRSLREEIGLTRMLIEQRFNACKTDTDLMMACGSLNSLILTVEKLVKSAHTIEQNLGILLSKSAVMALGQSICRLLIEELEGIENYEQIVDRITTRIFETISEARDTPDTEVKKLR